MASETTISEELFNFLVDYTNNHYYLEIILFLTHYPYTQFNESAIIRAMKQEGERRCIRESIRYLVDKGVIKTYIDNNVVLYSLTDNVRSLLLELAKLDTYQQLFLLRQTFLNSVGKEERLFELLATAAFSEIHNTNVTKQSISNYEKQQLHEDVSSVL